jgi:hypothetical protein
VNFTVVPVDEVLAVAGFPAPPAGVVVVTVAPQTTFVFGWFIVRVTGVGPNTLLPPASWTWTVTSQVELADDDVVAVLLQVLPVITSLAAGPDALTVAVAEPDTRPGTDAVTVQLPGAPVVVSVAVVLLDPAEIIELVGDTLQIPPLSTLKVTVWLDCAVAVAPFASFNVAVTVPVCGLPDGKSLWLRVTPTELGAPAVVNETFVKQPGSSAVDAESWSVPVVLLEGWVSEKVAVPLEVFLVDDAPAVPPSRLPVAPACDSVMLRPLSVVVRPFASWTETVMVDVWVDPATTLAGDAVQPSFAGAPTGAVGGTVIRQKMP